MGLVASTECLNSGDNCSTLTCLDMKHIAEIYQNREHETIERILVGILNGSRDQIMNALNSSYNFCAIAVGIPLEAVFPGEQLHGDLDAVLIPATDIQVNPDDRSYDATYDFDSIKILEVKVSTIASAGIVQSRKVGRSPSGLATMKLKNQVSRYCGMGFNEMSVLHFFVGTPTSYRDADGQPIKGFQSWMAASWGAGRGERLSAEAYKGDRGTVPYLPVEVGVVPGRSEAEALTLSVGKQLALDVPRGEVNNNGSERLKVLLKAVLTTQFPVKVTGYIPMPIIRVCRVCKELRFIGKRNGRCLDCLSR